MRTTTGEPLEQEAEPVLVNGVTDRLKRDTPSPPVTGVVIKERMTESGELAKLVFERGEPLVELAGGKVLVYPASPELDSQGIYDLACQLGYSGDPKTDNAQRDGWEEAWFRGWLVDVPTSVDSVTSLLRSTGSDALVAIDTSRKVIGFLFGLRLNSGMTAEKFKERELQMAPRTFVDDQLVTKDYLKREGNNAKVGWVEVGGVDPNHGNRDIFKALELHLLYNFFLSGEIDHSIGELLISPHVNHGSIKFHESRFLATEFARREVPNAQLGADTRTITWSVREWLVYARLVKARASAHIPPNLDFNHFCRAYESAMRGVIAAKID
ncbi:MAG: hypothetical protein Q8P95_05010 [bacterium]|nr:hypothetical protein [bacterium]